MLGLQCRRGLCAGHRRLNQWFVAHKTPDHICRSFTRLTSGDAVTVKPESSQQPVNPLPLFLHPPSKPTLTDRCRCDRRWQTGQEGRPRTFEGQSCDMMYFRSSNSALLRFRFSFVTTQRPTSTIWMICESSTLRPSSQTSG